MSLKRTIYRIDGKDYEKTDLISFQIGLQRVSINNVLNLASKNQLWVKNFTPYWNTHIHSSVDTKMKTFTFRGYAYNVAAFFMALGVHEYDDVKFPFNLLKSDFRAYQYTGNTRYDGIICYDPLLHSWSLKSNSPLKIEGTQRIINGKLWRKIATS